MSKWKILNEQYRQIGRRSLEKQQGMSDMKLFYRGNHTGLL